jgi:hypothetical protein
LPSQSEVQECLLSLPKDRANWISTTNRDLNELTSYKTRLLFLALTVFIAHQLLLEILLQNGTDLLSTRLNVKLVVEPKG